MDNDIKILKKYYNNIKIFTGFICLIALVIFMVCGEYLFDYFVYDNEPGYYGYHSNFQTMICIAIIIPVIFIPQSLDFLRFVLDLIFKKKKTKIVTSIKRPQYGLRYDCMTLYAKESSKRIHRFVVLNDIYSLKGKKVGNTYEVTYYQFSKVVTEMKKAKKPNK